MRSLVLFLVFLVVSAAYGQPTTEFVETKRRVAEVRIEGVVEQWMQESGAPGALVALVEGDEVLALQGFGFADSDVGTPMDSSSTVVWAGQLVRMLTAASLLRLHDSGPIDLDRDINTYLSQVSIEPAFIPPVTAIDLLTERSGIDSFLTGTYARRPDDVLALADFLRQRLPRRVRAAGSITLPSPIDFALAGQLVEALSGQSFANFLENELLLPLGMGQTSMRLDAEDEKMRAAGHRYDPLAGSIRPLDLTSFLYPQIEPADALWTTAADMSTWMQTLLSPERERPDALLESGSIDLVLDRQSRDHPFLEGRTLGMISGKLGAVGTARLQSLSNGFSTSIVLVPGHHLGVFMASNSEIDLDRPIVEILSLFLGRVRQELPAPIVDSTSRPQWTGTYRNATIAHSSPEKLLSLFRQHRVSGADDGNWTWNKSKMRPLGQSAFVVEPKESIVAFVPTAERLYLASNSDVWERISWWERWPIQGGLWWLFASALLAIAWTPVRLAPEYAGLEAADHSGPRWPFILARIVAAIYSLFFAGIAIWLLSTIAAGPDTLIFGSPPYLGVLLEIPRLALLLSLPVIASLPVGWLRNYWNRRYRRRLLWLSVIFFAVVPFLRYWKVLGFQI